MKMRQFAQQALPWAFLLLFDTAVQLFFKIGSQDLNGAEGWSWLLAILHSPSILAGIGCYLAAFITWTLILRDNPLSLAFPLTSAGYVTVPLAAYLFLGESIGETRWFGAALISAGFLCLLGERDT